MKAKTKTTATKEEATPALVPKLRFPEFRGAAGWSEEALSDVATIVMGSSPKSECYNQSEIGLPLLQGNADIKNRLSAPRIFTSEITKECTIGDILLSVRAPVGSVAKSIHHACIGRGIAAVRADRPNDQEFVYQWLLSYESRWVDISQGGTFDAVNSDDLKGVAFAVPNPAEQQKIAECLSSVDELMAAQARKVDALKTHKKGLMQQLFPREGETQPRLRFPEFQNAGEWEVRTMGSLASFSSGGTPSKDNPKYWNGSIPWVSASSMYDLVVEKADHYVTPLAIGNGTRIAKKGSILILVRGSMLFKRVPICVAGVDVAFNQDVKALDVDASIDTGFLLYQLSAFQARFPINETGIGAGKIELDHLKGFELFIPDTPEQQRIATCLSSLDALITAETQKHEALKTHKQGLMQQLFPSPEEVAA